MNENREARMKEFRKQFAQAMFGNKPVRRFVDILPDWALDNQTDELEEEAENAGSCTSS